MSQLHAFLAASFGFLSLLQPATSGHCQSFPRDDCQKSTRFVPGHNQIGKGVDITTLSRKGAAVVDTSRWEGPNGTCTLCQNPLMGSEKQRLPLAAAEWSQHGTCRYVPASVGRSELDVADAMTAEVKNDWKTDLGLPATPAFAFGGTRSKITLRALKYSQGDSYSFIKQEMYCEMYQLRLPDSPALLASHFSQDANNLPKEYRPKEYQHFIDIYGTHYISQVQLGARKRHLFAVQNCAAALDGFSIFDLKACLNSDASLGTLWKSHSKCRPFSEGPIAGSQPGAFEKWDTEVMGGDAPETVLFSEAQHSSGWMSSARAHPAVLSYSLMPLHTLLSQTDPRRTALKEAIWNYVTQRALRRMCNQQCPDGGFRSREDNCTCMCHASDLNNNMCCAGERGKARLKFHVHGASDLYGDNFSGTDGYVRVIFQGQVRQTRVIGGNDSPRWNQILDFGTVTLGHRNIYELEVWDHDAGFSGGDDLLRSFRGELKAGGPHEYIGYLSYGHVEFAYELQCAQTLGGSTCQVYTPLKRSASKSRKKRSGLNDPLRLARDLVRQKQTVQDPESHSKAGEVLEGTEKSSKQP